MTSDSTATAKLSVDVKFAVMRLTRRLRAERSGDEISHAQFTVLAIISSRGPQGIGQLSELERVTPPSMNRTVNCLEDAGLVERDSSPDDGRIVLVKMTETGSTLVRETQERRGAWLSARLDELTPAQRSTLEDAAAILKEIATQ